MRKVLKNSAGLAGELRRTNVRWALLTIVCLTAALLVWGCGGEPAGNDELIEPPPTLEELKRQWEGCMSEATESTESNDERISRVRRKHDDLFWRFPSVHGVGEGILVDGDGELTELEGIVITVTEAVDQSTLPEEDRIPDCLEGVPVQIKVEPFVPLWDFVSE